jgi:hypothetical protein
MGSAVDSIFDKGKCAKIKLLNSTPIATWNPEVKYIDVCLLNPETLISSIPVTSDFMDAGDEYKSRFRIMVKKLAANNHLGMYILVVIKSYFTYLILVESLKL